VTTEATIQPELNDRGLPGFGKELALDLGGCNPAILRNPEELTDYINLLIDRIGMTAYGDPLVAEFGNGVLFGVTVVQLITDSNLNVITTVNMHAEPPAAGVHINAFSCKDFDLEDAAAFSIKFFKAKSHRVRDLDRSTPPVEA
jgi:S-adenosylmethionine/arginine decarboxylase-like enzyme